MANEDTETDNVRVRIWFGDYEEGTEPDEIVTVEPSTTHIWKQNPHFHGSIAIDIHPDDCPATLEMYTSDSIHEPPQYDNHVEKGYWNGPIEQGLDFHKNDQRPPFGCEVWGRQLFFVKKSE